MTNLNDPSATQELNQQQQLPQQQQIQQLFFNPLNVGLQSNQINFGEILNSEQFPDILQHFASDYCRQLFELLKEANNLGLANKKGRQGGYTALHWMSIKNEVSLAEYLLDECKADVNSRGDLGETALFISIKNCNYFMIELLIKYGTDLTVRDVYNRSLVHWCAYTGKVVMLYYFQKYHSITNLNELDQFQQNALHIACACGYYDLVKYLLDTGEFNLFAQDVNGNTCLHMAAKSGMDRICWQITRLNNGECVRLVNVINNNNQKPFDIIRNERGFNYKKLRDWLRMESKTNDILLGLNAENISFDEKKNDNYLMPSRFPTGKILSLFPAPLRKKIHDLVKWNAERQANAEWYFRFTCFFLLITTSLLVNKFLIGHNTLWRGLVGYSPFILILYLFTLQKHRISHISGYENPYFMGYILALFVHNYTSFYTLILWPLNIISLSDLFSFLLSIWHIYYLYKLISSNPGFARENLKKSDGSPSDLRDLMDAHRKNPNNKPTKDSFNWLTEPANSFGHVMSNQQQSAQIQSYFCEACLIVQGVPAKHCKLCERCCLKFDHHCLFVNKCIGLKNHRAFIMFLFSTICCVLFFLCNVYFYFEADYNKLNEINELKKLSEQESIFYLAMASANHIWLIQLFVINGFTLIMVTFLFIFQLKFITLGYTSQFPPPFMFIRINKKMNTFLSSILHRLENLYIFLFQSFECNEELYHRQQAEYTLNCPANKTIALGLYPRNDQNADDYYYKKNSPRPNHHGHSHNHARCNHSHSNDKIDQTV